MLFGTEITIPPVLLKVNAPLFIHILQVHGECVGRQKGSNNDTDASQTARDDESVLCTEAIVDGGECESTRDATELAFMSVGGQA